MFPLDHALGSEYLPKVKEIEDRVEAKVSAKMARRVAEREAKVLHMKDIRTWASIADREAYRSWVYQLRRDWVLSVCEAGIATKEEAHALAKIQYPLE